MPIEFAKSKKNVSAPAPAPVVSTPVVSESVATVPIVTPEDAKTVPPVPPVPPATSLPPSISSVMIRGRRGGKEEKAGKPSTDFDTLCADFAQRFRVSSKVDFIDSGSIGFNYIFGGGIPRGRIIELHSDAGLGKSTCVLCWCLRVCQSGGVAILIDVEKALNESLIFGVGLEPYYQKTFIVIKPDTFEQTESIIDSLLVSNRVPELVVVDSITAMLFDKIVSGDLKIEDAEPGWHSRLTGNFLGKYKAAFARANSSLVIVNQKRTKFDFRGSSHVKAAGGLALEFWPDIRVDISLASWIEETVDGVTRKIGADITAECVKNKITMPFIKTVISIFFGKGISNIRAFTFLLQEEGAVKQNKAFYYVDMNGLTTSCQGRRALEEWVIKNEAAVIDFLRAKERL
jgi:recombination protein RecA